MMGGRKLVENVDVENDYFLLFRNEIQIIFEIIKKFKIY